MKDLFDHEEEFHSRDRKASKKSRKHAQETDRSKYKKSDQVEKEAKEIDPALRRGRVISIGGEGAWVDDMGHIFLCSLKGLLKKEKIKSKNLIAVGDWVRFSATSEKEGSIAHIEPRYSFLARTDVSGRKEQLIAVNVDQAVISISVVSPPLKPALVDRYLIAAEKGNINPLIVINKIDLLDTDPEEKKRYLEFLAAYEPLGIPILSISSKTAVGIDALRSILKDKATVFSVQSGVGKSSLINACFGLELKIGDLAQKTFKGSHTTSSATLIPLPDGGYCVDTPGIRSFGIWDLKKEEILNHFQDLVPFAEECRYPDCSHRTEPNCKVIQAVKEKKIASIRYESFRTLLDEAEGNDDNWAKRKQEPFS